MTKGSAMGNQNLAKRLGSNLRAFMMAVREVVWRPLAILNLVNLGAVLILYSVFGREEIDWLSWAPFLVVPAMMFGMLWYGGRK